MSSLPAALWPSTMIPAQPFCGATAGEAGTMTPGIPVGTLNGCTRKPFVHEVFSPVTSFPMILTPTLSSP